ncbi:glutathione S-transferase N-terminal domain-containing protein [Novosphingobium sp. B 225]|uniref:glutathione S-transferase N-terminal domain-containing protein n=1 Tax=Novosphingobium sp. B 225 TaxID=1961849 RepID=UPI000B4BAF92|nr:glutathione S-transferase N-terminal domain-containing protein [Novosphingobium sp. B 225]
MTYTLYGALGSPYSQKLRAVLRYRRLTHVWKDGAATRGALGQVRAPVIPVLQYPDGHFDNDSTPVIYDLEARHAERRIVPEDPAQAFIAHLLEDFSDEWLTKAMFGYRWLKDVDQVQMSRWLAFDNLKGGGLATSQAFAEQFRARQVGRMALVGCTAENFPLIEASTRAVLAALEAHVVERHCLFGTRPSLAEFGIFGQLSQLGTDPTPQAMMRADYPYTYRWLAHVDDMSGVDGEWEAGFAPLVRELVRLAGEVYVPFLRANELAAEAGAETFRMQAMGLPYEQGTFKYQLKCLRELRSRHAALDGAARAAADEVLGPAWLGLLAP